VLAFGWGRLSVLPVHALYALRSSCALWRAPGAARRAGHSLLLVAQNSGMKRSAGAWGARFSAGFQPALEEQPPSGCGRADPRHFWSWGVLLLGAAAAAKWTLHKACASVQSKLSICELSYLTLRMKTSKRGGGILTEKKPMKIYWKYGKDIDVLLYIDRIIFIKIRIHVQELAWSRVICPSPLAGAGEATCPHTRAEVRCRAACHWAGWWGGWLWRHRPASAR